MRDEDDPLAERAKTILFWVAAMIVGGLFYVSFEVKFPHLPEAILRVLTVAVVVIVATVISKVYHDP